MSAASRSVCSLRSFALNSTRLLALGAALLFAGNASAQEYYCPDGTVECGDGCMPYGSVCCGYDGYCDAGESCGNGGCISGDPGSSDPGGGDPGGGTCASGYEPCADGCMPYGSVCCGYDGYCDAGESCGATGCISGDDDPSSECGGSGYACGDGSGCCPIGTVCGTDTNGCDSASCCEPTSDSEPSATLVPVANQEPPSDPDGPELSQEGDFTCSSETQTECATTFCVNLESDRAYYSTDGVRFDCPSATELYDCAKRMVDYCTARNSSSTPSSADSSSTTPPYEEESDDSCAMSPASKPSALSWGLLAPLAWFVARRSRSAAVPQRPQS